MVTATGILFIGNTRITKKEMICKCDQKCFYGLIEKVLIMHFRKRGVKTFKSRILWSDKRVDVIYPCRPILVLFLYIYFFIQIFCLIISNATNISVAFCSTSLSWELFTSLDFDEQFKVQMKSFDEPDVPLWTRPFPGPLLLWNNNIHKHVCNYYSIKLVQKLVKMIERKALV